MASVATQAAAAREEPDTSPITQVQLAVSQAPAFQGPDDAFEVDDTPKAAPLGFFRRLCGCLCGGTADGNSRPLRPPPPRTIYVPPAPHTGNPFIPAQQERDLGKKTLVLDLDETLVHSSFKPVPNPDYVIPVEIDGKVTDVYVLKRPWVDHFLDEVGSKFEVIVFTASLAKYADPLMDLLDKSHVVRWRLFRESCYPYEGNYVKDLTCLGRDLRHTIIVDNSPHSYIFQPFNAVPVRNFIDDATERDLMDLLPLLQQLAACDDVTTVIADTFLPGVTAIFGGGSSSAPGIP